MTDVSYTGRFAPSPTGPLHFGSLVAALASYLDARACTGTWLVRIEDLDPPREQPGSSDFILKALDLYGLHWDNTIIYQHDRHDAYREILEQLQLSGQIYPCTCSRKQLAPYASAYPGLCRTRTGTPDQSFALRLNCHDSKISFNDLVQGQQRFDMAALGDHVVLRKDGLFAYQLAVTVDDAFQNITHIVRGSDLLDSTPRQICLQQALNYKQPVYAHIPVITGDNGTKLSKQNLAAPLSLTNPIPTLLLALQALGFKTTQDMHFASPSELLKWAASQWDMQQLPGTMSIPEQSLLRAAF